MYRAVAGSAVAFAAALLAGCGGAAPVSSDTSVGPVTAAPDGSVPGVKAIVSNDTPSDVAIGTTDYCVDDMVVQTRPLAPGTALAASTKWSALTKTMVCVEVQYPDGGVAQAALINPVGAEPYATYRAGPSERPLATLPTTTVQRVAPAADTVVAMDFGGGHSWSVERSPRLQTGTVWTMHVKT